MRRDVALLAGMARETDVSVTLSIPFSDDAMSRAIEPNTSPPSQRFETIRMLADAGIPTCVGVAPVIPGLNDSQVSEVLQRASAAGARRAFLIPVRLAAEVLPVFRERLEEAYPQRAAKIWNAIREMRGGKLNESEFGARMQGLGPRWEAIRTLFEMECERLGLNRQRPKRPETRTFRRSSVQGDLFESAGGLPS